jgi:hypothetical protein
VGDDVDVVHDLRELARNGRRWEARNAYIDDLVATRHPRAAEAIIGALAEIRRDERYPAIAALGDLGGPEAVAALRALLRDADLSRGERGATTTSLARAAGADAIDDVHRELVAARDHRTRGKALAALSYLGTDVAWEDVLRLLPKFVISRASPSELQLAIAYLIIHRGDDPDRTTRLRAAIDKARPKLEYAEDREFVDGLGWDEDPCPAIEWAEDAMRLSITAAVVGPPKRPE